MSRNSLTRKTKVTCNAIASHNDSPANSDFSEPSMTALSLKTINTSQIQQKQREYLANLARAAVSAAWSTEINNKKSFNNQEFDSAVFFRSSSFKRQKQTYLH